MTRKIFLSLFSLVAAGLFLVPNTIVEARLSVSPAPAAPFSNAIGLNNTLYVTGFDCSCMDVYNIADKQNPVLLATTTTRSQPGFVIANGNYVSVGTYGGFFQTWDMTDPSNPVLVKDDNVAKHTGLTGINLGGTIRLANNYFFVPFIQNNFSGPGGIMIFDLTDPSSPTPTSTILFSPNTSGGGDVLINGNDMYATDYSAFKLRHYDISDIQNPVLIQEITNIHEPLDYTTQIESNLGFEPWGLMSNGNALYLTDDNVMQVYDISSSTHMVYATTTVAFKDIQGFGIKDNVLYYSASFDHLIAYYDVTDEMNPRFLARTSTGLEGSDLSNIFTGSRNYWLSFDSNGYYYVNDVGFNTVSVYEPLRLIPSVLSLSLIKKNTTRFSMSLPVQPASDVTVTFATTTTGGEPCVTTSPNSIVFTPTNWRDQQTLTIQASIADNACPVGTIINTQPLLSSSDPYYNSALVGKIKTTIIDGFESAQNSFWNLGVTWQNINSVIPGVDYPASTSDVVIKNSVTVNTSESVHDITINQGHELLLSGSQPLSIYGTLINNGRVDGTLTFINDSSTLSASSTGTFTKSPVRKYTANATTTKNFLTDGGRNDWIVVADGAVINIASSTYATTTNIFKAINGGSFNFGANPAGKVVPNVVITTPTTTSFVAKWSSSVNWDDSASCYYSYDNFTTVNTVTCANNGSDIGKPLAAGTTTLYVRGVNSQGSLTERSVTFTYDNTVPIPTLCGTDLLDEASRPYYYLTSNVTGDCHATVNTELHGASTTNVTGYAVTGNFIGTTTGTGLTISLRNITISGSVFASGASGNGTGYNGGIITIATSTTGSMYSNGGDGTTQGGNGGAITVSNSAGIASSTLIFANGGNATVCGRGGNGGSISLINSQYGSVNINPGNDQTTIGNGLCVAPPSGSSGSSGSQSVVGLFTPPPPNTPTIPPVNTAPAAANTNSAPSSVGGSGGNAVGILPTSLQVLIPTTTAARVVENTSTFTPIITSIKEIVKGTTDVVNSPTSKAVQTVGFFAGLLGAISLYTNALFATPLLASEVLLIPIRLWGLFLMGFGLRKRTPPWGTVYDSVTKQPIDPAFVTATDMNGKVVAESITDIDGRYGFLLPDGTYHLSVQRSNYEFPSKKMVGKTADEMYRDLYFGEEVTVVGGQVIDKNIPLDRENFDWNEEAKSDQDVMVFHKKNEKIFRKIGNWVFRIGSVISVVSVILNPSTYNIVIIMIYALIAILSYFGVKGKKLGFVRDRITGRPFSYAIFRVTSTDHQTVLRSGVCDKEGRYYCIVPKGEYYLELEKKNRDGSYTKVFQSDLISSNNGIINKNFAI